MGKAPGVRLYVVVKFGYVEVRLYQSHSDFQCLFVGESQFQVLRASVEVCTGYISTLSLSGFSPLSHWSMFTSDCRWQRRLAVRYNVGFLEQNGCTH